MSTIMQTHLHCYPVWLPGRAIYRYQLRYSQGHRNCEYLGTHDSVEQCINRLKEAHPENAKNFTKRKLALNPEETDEPEEYQPKVAKRLFEGISPEWRSGRIVWKVQSAYGGNRYDTQVEAASVYSRARNKSLEEVRLKDAQLPILPIARQQQELRDFMLLYHGRYPGDACNTDVFAHSAQLWRCFEAHCGIIPMFLVAKYTKDRNDVLRATTTIMARLRDKAQHRVRPAEEDILYDIMVLASKHIARHVWPKSWELCVGRGNYHWMTFHFHMTKLGVLTLKSPSSGAKGLKFQNSGTMFYVQPLNAQIRKNIRSQILFGEGCLRQLQTVPSTGPQYLEAFNDIESRSGALVGATDGTSYTRKWLKRGFLRLLMQSYGVTLSIKDLSVRQYCACFPDQHKRLFPLLSTPDLYQHASYARSMVDAMKDLGYTDDAELLSMHACLFDCFAAQVIVRSKGPGWIKNNIREMKTRMNRYKQANGIWPHPAVLLTLCKDIP